MINIPKFDNLWISSEKVARTAQGSAKKWKENLPPIDPEVARRILEKKETKSSGVIVASPHEL